MDLTLCQSLINWLKRFPDHEELTTQKLTDGIAIARILNQIAPEFFSAQWLSKIKQDVGDNWRLKVSNLRKIHEGMMDYYRDHLDQPVRPFPAPNLNKIGEHSDEAELGRLLQLVLGCAVNCQQKKRYIEAIMEMEENVQTVIVKAIQELMIPPSDVTQPGLLDTSPQSPPDPSNEGYKAVHEQLEATTREKDLIVQRCNELDHQLSMVTEERNKLKGDIKHLEDQLDDPGLTNNRVKELRKKIETLQDELYKIETSRDDYRVRVETLEKENMENNALISEREILATKVNTLQDEVDALREMKEKVPLLEGTIESYKKKQEELGDLRRQVKILQDKNSQYMQQNLEVEEDLKEERKRSSTWRPQLDLLRDEVNSLRQKISDEIKKSDRLSFDNKKLNEKMEAEIEEKKRIQGNYQLLKEKYDELKYSAVNSPESSKDPSNYSGLETVELIPHEIREQLARLKLENTTLKKQCNEPDPVLQSKLEDLSERHDKLLQENRFARTAHFLPSASFPWGSNARSKPHVFTQTFLDAYFMLDTSKKLKLLRKNLKWASESDLLILRQPNSLVASMFPGSSGNGVAVESKTLSLPSPSTAALPPIPSTKDSNPIVIRHIHEFKMPPSPTNEDSGCCRTSPSSCEGCEDHSSSLYDHTASDYGGTLDSGICGMCRCISPMIPSIVEECTTHHMSDIIPALVNQEGGSHPVMYHSHPNHSSSLRCCSPKNSDSENLNRQSTCPVRPQSECSFVSLGSPLGQHPVSARPNDSVTDGCSRCCTGGDKCGQFPAQRAITPPESPTPHNSPRLPHSINSSRSKSVRLSKKSRHPKIVSEAKEFPNISGSLSTENTNSVKKVKTPFKSRSKSLDKTRLRNEKHEKNTNWSLDDANPTGKVRASFDTLNIQRSNENVCKKHVDSITLRGIARAEGLLHGSSLHSDCIDGPLPSSMKNQSSKIKAKHDSFSEVFYDDNASNSKKVESRPFLLGFRNFGPNLKKCESSSPKEYLPFNPYFTRVQTAGTSTSLNSLKDIPKNKKGNSGLHFASESNPNISAKSLKGPLQKQSHLKPLPKSLSDPSVTLVTDSMFTHFAISRPPKSNKQKKLIKSNQMNARNSRKSPSKDDSLLPATDTDDIELIENKLASSGYGAPIVSSESFLSMGQSGFTTDLDPSATDYCTDNDDQFNPAQFRVDSTMPLVHEGLTDSLRRSSQISNKPKKADPFLSLARANRIFRKKKIATPKAGSPPYTPNRGIIKIKNKTAKTIVNETINYVFHFCTP